MRHEVPAPSFSTDERDPSDDRSSEQPLGCGSSFATFAALVEERCPRCRDYGVEAAEFASWLFARLGNSIPTRTLDRLRFGDLLVAFAIARKSVRALAEFERLLTELYPSIRTYDRTGDLADEVIQDLRTRMIIGDPSKPPGILDYGGHGTLAAWLRSAAIHASLNKLRSLRRAPPLVSETETEDLVGLDLELASMRLAYRAEFAVAFQQALAELEPRSRNLLRIHLVDRVPIDRLAPFLAVHRATAFRWVSAARNELVERTRTRLKQRLALRDSEVSSAIRLLASQLELSVRSALNARK